MSYHAPQTPQTEALLAKQRRKSLISSVITSILVLILLALILALVTLVPLMRETPVIVSYSAVVNKQEELAKTKTTLSKSKPSAPSSMQSRVIASSAPSPIAIPTVDVEVETPSLEFGVGDDFGEGLLGSGDGGSGSGRGGGSSGFGSVHKIAGALTGSLYDFKQDDSKRPTKANPNQYGRIVERIQRKGFSKSAFKDYFRAPKDLSLTTVAIPIMDADRGPKEFGAQKYIKPSMWLAHYHGNIIALEPGEYRFVGVADDFMSVFIDGDPVLVAHRAQVGNEVRMRWRPARESNKWSPPFLNEKLVVGDWVNFKEGKLVRMDLAIGERPGGKVGFILMIQKKGEKYRKAKGGRPILPLFTTAEFSNKNRRDIERAFRGYDLEWSNVPVFPAQ